MNTKLYRIQSGSCFHSVPHLVVDKHGCEGRQSHQEVQNSARVGVVWRVVVRFVVDGDQVEGICQLLFQVLKVIREMSVIFNIGVQEYFIPT